MVEQAKPVVREATFADGEAVEALQRTAGLTVGPDGRWPRLWNGNPIWDAADPKPSMGWVLEAEGRVVGYIGNIPLLCHMSGKTLAAAAATNFAVADSHKGYGLLLVSAFFKQKGVDILLNTTANNVTASIFQRFKAAPLPQEEYNKILFWVLRPQPFVAAVLRRSRLNPALGWFASKVGALLLRGDTTLRNRKPKPIKLTGASNSGAPSGVQMDIQILEISDIGPEFGDLWSRKIKEDNRLLSDRTPEVLRWHFAQRRTKVICCYRSAELLGYAIVTRDDSQL